MSVHVGIKSANMLSCGSQRAEASSPQIAAARHHSLAADSLALRLWHKVPLNMSAWRTGAPGIQILGT